MSYDEGFDNEEPRAKHAQAALAVRTAPTPGGALDSKRLAGGLASGNGIIDPERWQMLAAIAETVHKTAFVPTGLRGNAPSTLACLLYGDAQGLHPMVALKEVHVIDGTPSMSAALMVAQVRTAGKGHRIRREEIRDADGKFVGCTAHGTRGDDGEEDTFSFTLEMAARAGLLTKNNWKNYPEAMCWHRAASQLCTFLFPDVFMGSPYVPEELGVADTDETGRLEGQEPTPASRAGESEPATDAFDSEILEVEPEGTESGPEKPQEPGTPPAEPEAAGAPAAAQAPGEPATGDSEGQLAIETDGARVPYSKQTIPVILGFAKQAPAEWLEGYLNHERTHKNRARLIAELEGMLAEKRAGVEKPVVGDEADETLEERDELVKETLDKAVTLAPTFAPAAEPEGADVHDPAVRVKIVRLKAAITWLNDQHEELREWRYEAVVASASRIWNKVVHTLEDLTEVELDQIWAAVPEDVKEALGLVSGEQLEKLADKAI